MSEEIGFEPTRIGNIRSVSNRSHLTNSCALPRGVEGIEPTTGWLRVSCSTTELYSLIEYNNIIFLTPRDSNTEVFSAKGRRVTITLEVIIYARERNRTPASDLQDPRSTTILHRLTSARIELALPTWRAGVLTFIRWRLYAKEGIEPLNIRLWT